jgi:hypothetical protein
MNGRPAPAALAGLLLVIAIVVTACTSLASPDPLAGAADGTGLLPGGRAEDRGPASGGGTGCSEPGSPGGEPAEPDPSAPTCEPVEPGPVDPNAVVTSPPLEPGASIPGEPQAGLVEPVAGVIDPRPVAVDAISATVEDGRLVVRLEWISGVEPCYALATVLVERDGSTFVLTPLEGSAARDVACIDIAMYKATLVDLGSLPAGEYTVLAGQGEADPVTVAVP